MAGIRIRDSTSEPALAPNLCAQAPLNLIAMWSELAILRYQDSAFLDCESKIRY